MRNRTLTRGGGGLVYKNRSKLKAKRGSTVGSNLKLCRKPKDKHWCM